MKKNAKNVVLPHSQAKLDLYKKYLEHYLRVLGLAQFCTRINIYDIFCGIGLYEDGNIGSPLIAAEAIKANNAILAGLSRQAQQVSLTINDNQIDKINSVKQLLEDKKVNNCGYSFYNKDANEMLDIVIDQVNSFKSTERNLVFVDPYGYSFIQKEKLGKLLKNAGTEIVLFLPVMQMYRFTNTALSDYERSCYVKLREFVQSFFPADHIIHKDGITNIFEYINEIKKALSFDNQYYTCSHYIERETGNYFGLFFITPNLYGLEKMIETKWSADPVTGKGFKQERQSSLFDEQFKEIDQRRELDYLKTRLLEEIRAKKKLTNTEIYKLTLMNEFKPSHANSVLKELIKHNLIKVKSTESNGGESGFGISYKNFAANDIKANFII